jgi:hypothetical protein
MKLYSNHMRLRVALYVLYRTKGEPGWQDWGYFGFSSVGTSLTPGRIVMVELNFL